MKKTIGILGSVCIGCAAVSSLSAAESGPYLKAEIGPTLVEDVTLRDFVGVSSGNKVEFEPGVRFAVGGGYSFGDFVAIGGETGVSYNNFKRISGAFFNEDDSGVGNVPLLANIVFKLPNKSRLVPFVGGGAGVSFTFFSADDLVFDNGVRRAELEGGESDAVFAWQLFGGLKYQLNDNMSMGVSYKYLRTEAPDWEVDEDIFTGLSTDVRLSRMETHALTFIFSLRF